METMNDQVRTQVRVRLAERNKSQADLARELGMHPQYLSKLLTGRIGRIPPAWEKVLKQVGLKLVAVPDPSGET